MASQTGRTAILIRCTHDEAQIIREAARRERRTISAFVLNAVMTRVATQKRIAQNLQNTRTGQNK
jgi:uncharacterized protein (DUF1778 family)